MHWNTLEQHFFQKSSLPHIFFTVRWKITLHVSNVTRYFNSFIWSFYFQRRSLCSPKKVFCAHYVLSMSLFSMELFLSENLVNGALENGTTVKGNDNECLTRHCKSTFEFQCYGNTNHNVSYVITNTLCRHIYFHTNLQSNIK